MGSNASKAGRTAFAVLAFIAFCVSGCLVVNAFYGLTYAALGRDQGIFQYTGWALSKGERLYRDVHDINGPLPSLTHWLVQSLFGKTERAFRVADVCFTIFAYGFFGASLARATGTKSRFAPYLGAVTTCIVLGSQYVTYGFWHTAQRDHHSTLLVLLGLAFLLPPTPARTLHRRARVAAGALLLTLPLFGKPTFALFAFAALVLGYLDARKARSTEATLTNPREFLVVAVSSMAITAAVLALVLWKVAEPSLYVRFVFVETTKFHRYFWIRNLLDCFSGWDTADRLQKALAFLALGSLGLVWRPVRERFSWILFVPFVAGFASYLIQQKGFPYHLHPVTTGARVVFLGVAFTVVAHAAELRESISGWRFQAWALVCFVAMGGVSIYDAATADAQRPSWRVDDERERLNRFPWGDYFAGELADAADYVNKHTPEGSRVQVYGFDPYVLFRANRLSATPILYNFDLHAPTVLEDARVPAGEKDWIRAYLDENRKAFHARIVAEPPAAWVFIDHAPFHYPKDGFKDFETCCANTAAYVKEHYVEASAFGHFHVYLKR